MNNYNRKDIRKYITKTFSKDELKIICFDLGLDYEGFDEKKTVLVVDLLKYLEQKNQLPNLVRWLNEEGYLSRGVEPA